MITTYLRTLQRFTSSGENHISASAWGAVWAKARHALNRSALLAVCLFLGLTSASFAGDVSRARFVDTSGSLEAYVDGESMPGPDQFRFRVNGDADILDFLKTGSDRKLSMLWKIEKNKFCMVRVIDIRGEYLCYKVKFEKDGVIELKNNRAPDNMPDRIVLFPQ